MDSAQPPTFKYLSAPEFEKQLQGALAEAGQRQPAVAEALAELQALAALAQPRWGQECGQAYHDAVRQREACGDGSGGVVPAAARVMESSYGADGRLLALRPLGECVCM